MRSLVPFADNTVNRTAWSWMPRRYVRALATKRSLARPRLNLVTRRACAE